MNIFVDIDETICRIPPNQSYPNAFPLEDNIKKVNELHDAGHTITYWTARGAATKKDWTDVTRSQLEKWGCRYHHLKLDKPSYDVFIDDKNINSRDWEAKGNDILESIVKFPFCHLV